MISSMHKIIAKKVFDHIESEFKIVLNIEKFKSGSIAPDIHPLLMFNAHTINSSLGYLNKNINILTDTDFNNSRENLDSFSFKLGVIIHYISDYFCRAHNDKKYTNFFSHYFYEKRLATYFKRMENTDYLNAIAGFGIWDQDESLTEIIKKKHSDYVKTKRTMRNDINFSIFVSANIALNIVYRVIENSNSNFLKSA